ncbi:endonuclease/exonuclease/phosphatase family protein [Aliikangiella coralliicola]|uniref:Endonuclease/exonuclease/phosphatase n=1 Tax=Aliikangiella coralliicola TaxID=2592383 RepID=A0A545UDP8_9GAMM|nr:endonuclease/exonuclease/phosphatase family protein [Aliikangiella coralliicola]TQV87573.1 endonuclease/exonuclease/phosphatase [Aliikangiella coralliicola]
MTEVTIATFNVENLFTRYNFRGKRVKKNGKSTYVEYTPKELAKATKDGFIIDKKVFKRYMEPNRKLTAKALKAIKADIIGLQEVESLDTLKLFNSTYLKSKKFKFPLVIDGNDPRFIDVGLLSNFEIDFVRTHQFTKTPRSSTKLFSRDCLEVHIKINDNKILPIFVNHFKSMIGGRPATKKRRLAQANGMVEILKERFGENYGRKDFVILGDFNDYIEVGKENESGMKPLLDNKKLVNVSERLPKNDRWTHFYKRNKSYRQLDYILLSKSLANKNSTVKPLVERRGQPLRVNQKNKPKRVKKFFSGIEKNKKASDHCPVSIKITV